MVHQFPGLEVNFDGPDLAGKDALLFAVAEFERMNGKRVFDINNYWKQLGEHPPIKIIDTPGMSPEEIKRWRAMGEGDALSGLIESYDVFLTSEPSYVGVGKVIREEIIRKSHDRYYSARATAMAYDLDRLVLRQQVIHPLLAMGKTVFQSRSVSTTLAYQPLMVEQAQKRGQDLGFAVDAGHEISRDELMMLPGNAFALDNYANMLVLAQIRNPDVLLARMKNRSKQDDAVFENYDFLKGVNEIFTSEDYRAIFEDRGVLVRYTDAEAHVDPKTSIRMAVEETLGHYVELLTAKGRIRSYSFKDIPSMSEEITTRYLSQ